MAHRYYVEWSAPIPANSGSTRVLADDKRDAISTARIKLGDRVKKQHLNRFNAWRVVSKSMRPHREVVKTYPQFTTRHVRYVRTHIGE